MADKPTKLLFDECVGLPLVEQLAGVIGADEGVTLGHVIPLGFGGVNDDEWIPQIAKEGWVIITSDRAGNEKPAGERSFQLCVPL